MKADILRTQKICSWHHPSDKEVYNLVPFWHLVQFFFLYHTAPCAVNGYNLPLQGLHTKERRCTVSHKLKLHPQSNSTPKILTQSKKRFSFLKSYMIRNMRIIILNNRPEPNWSCSSFHALIRNYSGHNVNIKVIKREFRLPSRCCTLLMYENVIHSF